MANNNSNVSNPFLQNIDRPFSEIFELLPLLGKEISKPEILEAIETHSVNASYQLISGLQSLGVLLAIAVDQEEEKIGKKHLANIGWLIHSLGDLLNSCVFVKDNFDYSEK
jgi:hypothetical protein